MTLLVQHILHPDSQVYSLHIDIQGLIVETRNPNRRLYGTE